MLPGWNTPQGVENVRTICGGKPESDDGDNNISLNRLETSQYIKHYINEDYYYYKA